MKNQTLAKIFALASCGFAYGCGDFVDEEQEFSRTSAEDIENQTEDQGAFENQNIWYTGDGEPTPDFGRELDVYLDKTTGTFWEKRDGEWISIGDFSEQGQDGEAGNEGDQGETGETGEQGARGDQGETGETGVQGAAGDVGDDGDQGDQGDQGEAGVQGKDGLDNKIVKIIECSAYIPGEKFKVDYIASIYETGDIHAAAVIYSGDNVYGNFSRTFMESSESAKEARVIVRFDRESDSTWGYYEIGAYRDDGVLLISYRDPKEKDEDFKVNKSCWSE